MNTRIDGDLSSYRLRSYKHLQEASSLKKASAYQQVKEDKKESIRKIVSEKNLQLAKKVEYKKIKIMDTKVPKQVIKTYASHRKAIYEDRIRTRFDLLL